MNNIFYTLLTSVLCTITSILLAAKTPTPRVLLDMNTGWAFYPGDVDRAMTVDYDDSQWEAVSIPHIMRVERKHNGGAVFQGTGWYRRYFRLSDSYRNKRITLQFEGVQSSCVIYLNGKEIAAHAGGYLGFSVDVTPYISYDRDNVLALRVTNKDDAQTPPGKPMRKLDFNYYGGIYRNVKMLVTDSTYISDPLEADIPAGGGILVSFPTVTKEKATISCRTHVVNGRAASGAQLRLETTVQDETGNVVTRANDTTSLPHTDTTFSQHLQVSSPRLWHPDHPFRYRLVSRIYRNDMLVDEVTTWIGIRRFDMRSSRGEADGLYLNGEKLYIRGANRHQAFPYVGDAASNSMQVRDVIQLKKGGFNAVRAAHYPPSVAFLDACDSLGLLVIECQPGWQYFSEDPLFIQRTYRDIRQMIRRDRNHPSIFLWETSLNESPTPSSWMKEAVKIAHDELPGDQLFTADDLNERSRPFYDVFYKVIHPDGTDPFPGLPSFTREWGDAWFADPSKENGLRASRIYGEKGLINQCILRQNALNGEKDESLGGYWDHAGLDANPRIGGYFLWSFNDYTRGYDPITAFSGVVDLDRYPKFGYYQMQAMQDPRNPAYGPTIHIASYHARKDLDSTIIVFSNCDTVRLFRNGILVGVQDRKSNASTAPFIYNKDGSPYFRFSLPDYEPGALKAEGILDGNIVATHCVETPGPPHHLEIEFADQGIAPIAGGSDMVPVYIKVCDKRGNLVHSASRAAAISIKLTVFGNGKLIGNNNPQTGVSPQVTEGGIAYALIRTTYSAGPMVIQASSAGLRSATAEIKSIANPNTPVPDGKHARWVGEYDHRRTKTVNTDAQKQLKTSIDLRSTSVSVNGQANEQIQPLFDGNLSTVWQEDKSALPITLSIDLETKYKVDAYRIYWGKDSDWYVYTLESSINGQHWKPIESHVASSGQDYNIKNIHESEIRYLRLRIEGIRPENSKPAVRELELFGKKAE
ncbi:glycoside hydrolase family 2 TIM barrel-domain containing protein [Sphingobacterium thalpophilum]|uniref:Glycoside hydrolase family 2 TIM barrel-domain containing protein n=1 Tax=Sphingobacterium thalpophilum TaxID=259 RepID=A0ABV4H8I9_9SPHI